MRFAQVFLALLTSFFVTSCATSPDLGAFDVSVVNVTSGEATFWETRLDFMVRLQNSTPNPVVLEGAAHKIYLNGTYIGQGLSNERVEVPRLGTTTQTVTVTLKNLTLMRKLIEFGESQNQKVSYRVNSTLYASGGGMFSRKFTATKEGGLDLGNLATPANGGARPASSVQP